jgi:hypothetical protein
MVEVVIQVEVVQVVVVWAAHMLLLLDPILHQLIGPLQDLQIPRDLVNLFNIKMPIVLLM